jgi:Flp pilus assembly protein TadD
VSAVKVAPFCSASLVRTVLSGRGLLVSLGLAAACVFIYAPVRTHAFLSWDDTAYVSDNIRVAAGLTSNGVRWAFTTGYMANWHPLTWLSHMLDVELLGLNAGPLLCVNVLFHVLNAVLLFALLCKMTGSLGRSAFVAALFAVHPLHVESVAWLSERKDVLSTFLGLLTLWAYVEYARRPERKRYFLVILLFALGLMAKPMLVTLPFVMLLVDYWPLRRMTLGADSQVQAGLLSQQGRRVVMRLAREKLPLVGIAVISSIVTYVAQQRAGAVSVLARLPLWVRAENALVSYAAYIGKMLWPASLSALYPLSRPAGVAVLGSALLLAVITAAVTRDGHRRPYLAVGWLWYLGMLVPVIGLIQVGSQSMADRYTYVPIIGLFIMVGWGIPDLLARVRCRKVLLAAAAGTVLLASTIAARAQVRHWKDSATLWTHALEVTADNDIAHNLLGEELAKEGKLSDAVFHYTEALRINPGNAEAHNNLGLALADQGKIADGIAHYTEALRLKPSFVDAHYNMGLALATQGKTTEAIEKYRAALRINREFVKAHNNLGVILAQQGKTREARSHFMAVLRLRPDDPDAHNNLGILLASQGRIDEAETHFSEALRLRPDFESARNNLNIIRAQQGRGRR